MSGTNPNELYIQASRSSDSDITFWGEVPNTLHDAVKIAIAKNPREERKRKVDLDDLKLILRDYHKKLGIYSPLVEEHLGYLDRGSVLVGQQPVLMGGPGLIANKLSCLLVLSDIFKEEKHELAPVFFVGDYDGLQKELARQYFPNPISHNAFIIDSEDYLPEESDIAAHAAKVPPIEWLDEYLIKLEENLRGFKSQVKGEKKKLFDERWAHIKTILRTSMYNSETLSEWAVRVWGLITNVISDYGVIFLPTSHPEIRKLVASEYFQFIDKADTYTKTFQKALDQIKELGYEPTLPHRHNDYAPFTLECKIDQNRMTTTISTKEDGKFAEGQCQECKTNYSYDVSTSEKLQEISDFIGPRVDSSQAIFQDLMNIKIRISGPGEIAYYAQAAPAVAAIGIDLPVFVKYSRAFYNATWIEKLGKTLAERKQGSLHTSQLFEILRKRVDGEKSANNIKVHEAEKEMEEFIMGEYQKLLSGKQSVDPLKYLGWQYGRFTPEKFGQEVSWVWFDMALQTGLSDYIPAYMRMYHSNSTVGGVYYINSLL